MRSFARRKIFYGWVVVAGAWLLWLYNTMAFTWGFTVFVEPLDREFGLSRTSITVAWAVTLSWSLLLGPWAGRLFDRLGPRPLVMIFGPVAGIGWIAIALSHSYWTFFLAFVFLVGTGIQLGLNAPAQSVVAQWFRLRRSLAMGIFLTASGFTGVTLVPLVSWLIARYSWRTGALVLGTIIAVTTVPIGALLRHRPEDLGLEPDGITRTPGTGSRTLAVEPALVAETHFTPREAYLTAAFWLFTAATWLRWLGLGLLQVHQMPYLLERGLTAGQAATIVGLSLFVNSPSRIAVGLLGDALSKRWLLVAFMLLQGAGLTALAFIGGMGLGYAYAVLWGIGQSALVLQGAWLADTFGRKFYGSINGVAYNVAQSGRVVGGLGAAIVYDLVGGYRTTFMVGAAGFALGALLIALIPTPRAAERPVLGRI